MNFSGIPFFGQDETKIFFGPRSIRRREWPFGARRVFSEWHSRFLEQAELLEARRGGDWVPIFQNHIISTILVLTFLWMEVEEAKEEMIEVEAARLILEGEIRCVDRK